MDTARILNAACGLMIPFISHADTIAGRVTDEAGASFTEATISADDDYSGNIGALDEVVVTATRTPKPLKDVPVITRLISTDDIKKTDATNIKELLTELLPGLEFTYTMSQETTLSMSNFGGKSILFLVDGERLAGETMDNVDFNRLALDNIARVEVVKGASSALYGASAVGGVVNLITRQPDGQWHVNLNTRYNSLADEWRTGAGIDLHRGKWASNTSVQHTSSKTVRLTDAFDTESALQYLFGGSSLIVNERLTFTPSTVARLTARAGYFRRVSNRTNYDDHYIDRSAGLRGTWDITSRDILELSYSFDRYDKERHIGGRHVDDHDYSNRLNIVHALYTRFDGNHTLTAGADFMHDYLMTYQFVNGASHSQSSVDAFIQFDWTPLPRLNLVASVRDDYFSASRCNAVTTRLATMLKFDRFSIRANYAGGFRAPSLKEMYMNFDMAGIQMIYGNPDLKPEKSHNFNLALEHSGHCRRGILAGAYSVSATGNFNLYDSRITTTDYPGNETDGAGAIYCNEDGVKVAGIDISARYRLRAGLGLQFDYNYLHAFGRTVDSQFSNPRPHSMTWRVDYEKRLCPAYKFYVGLSGRYLAKPRSQYPTDGDYSVWKLTLRQEVWQGISLNFMVDNLLGYKPRVYFWNTLPTTGRTWSLGASLDIDTMLKRR